MLCEWEWPKIGLKRETKKKIINKKERPIKNAYMLCEWKWPKIKLI